MSGLVVDREGIDALIREVTAAGYEVIGPTVRDGTIVYEPIGGTADLPVGWRDRQDGATYRLERRQDSALFGYVLGPHSWKQYLFPPRTTLLHVSRRGDELEFTTPEQPSKRYAFFGARSCELAAIAIQDKVFLESGYVDPTYQAARQGVLTIGVNCTEPGGTCFCSSIGTGPRCTRGYDVVVTEIIDGDRHEFLLESGSDRGRELLSAIDGRTATDADHAAVADLLARAAASMGRHLETAGLKERLYDSREHPRWRDVADRCLACANCTLVCPTCFCSTTEDTATLDGTSAERSRRWDSCFALDFSSLHGRPVRHSTQARYRQWITHKLASWQDQFDSIGCVGCGRCITWCPVGIDITEEAAAIESTQEVSR